MSTTGSIRVWDVPTRLFHWLLVALFAFSWWSAENHEMEWHYLSGLTFLGLLAFRLVWGVIGSSTARFTAFVASPSRLAAYLRGEAPARAGHNPLGGYSVVAMLLVLAAQVGTGLFATDIDGLESGPLSYLLSFDQSRVAAEVHEVAFNLALALIALHVLAILFYLVVRRRNLIRPMITGRDRAGGDAAGEMRPAGAARFVFAALLAILVVWITTKGLSL